VTALELDTTDEEGKPKPAFLVAGSALPSHATHLRIGAEFLEFAFFQCAGYGGKPYTLHPTPHYPNPTPYTLHPTPYTVHPTP